MKFTVKRSLWLRGEGSTHHNGSFLLRKVDGKMCCLGFLGLACGYTQDQISGITSPAGLAANGIGDAMYPSKLQSYKPGRRLGHGYSPEADELMGINDDVTMKDHDREARLTERFKMIGVEVEFVD